MTPNTATVSGTVTVDGQPLADGVVTFRPTADTPGPEFAGEVARGPADHTLREARGRAEHYRFSADHETGAAVTIMPEIDRNPASFLMASEQGTVTFKERHSMRRD